MSKEAILQELGNGFEFDIHFYSERGKRDLADFILSHAKEVAIGFRVWCDDKGWFCQMKDQKLGYIRQENQIVFSPWISPEELFNQYIESLKTKQP